MLLVVLPAWLIAATALAQAPAFRVKDINRQPVVSPSTQRDIVSRDGVAFFVSDSDKRRGERSGRQCDEGITPNGCCAMDCTPLPGGTSCLGGVCIAAGVCDGAGTCNPGPPLDCDDRNPLTQDSCDMVLGCVHRTPPCTGDCNGDRVVTIDEILRMVNTALTGRGNCINGDANEDAQTTIDEIIAAVGNALAECPG